MNLLINCLATIKSTKTSVAKVGKVTYKKVKGYYYASAKVTAVKAGKATIKAYAKYGKKSTSWKVAVKEATPAPVGDLAITAAKQASATTATVTFNKAPATTDVITVSRGTSSVAIAAQSTDGNTVTLTFASALVKDTYTVKVTSADKKEITGTFTAEAAKLTKINWLSDTLNVAANTTVGMQTVSTVVKGQDQWGNEMALTGATWTSSDGTPAYATKTGKLTITKSAGFTIGSTVTVICVVQNEAIAENHNFKIGMMNSVSEFKMGEMTSDDSDYKDLKNVTEKALEDGNYYIPVEAKDSNGVALTADDLNGMLNGTLFITPNSTTNTGVLYFDGFITKNGKPAMKVAAGLTTKPAINGDYDLVADMPAVLSVLSTGAAGTSTKNVTIYRNSVIKDMTISLPSDLYAGKTSEFTVSATDQNGTAVSMYDYAVAATGSSNLTFKDGTSLTVTGGTITVTKDKSKKSVTFEVKPNGTAAGIVSITGTTKGLGSVIVNANYAASRTTSSVSALNKDVKTKLATTASLETMGTPTFAWSDGAVIKSTDSDYLTSDTVTPVALNGTLTEGKYATENAIEYNGASGGFAAGNTDTVNKTSLSGAVGTTYAYAYSIDDESIAEFVSAANTAVAKATAANEYKLQALKAGSTKLKVHLYSISWNATDGYVVKEIDTKSYDLSVVNESKVSYQLEAEKGASLYVGATTADNIKLTLTDANGAAVDQSLLTSVSFECDDASYDGHLTFNGSATQPTVTGDMGTWDTNKTATVTATATIANDGDTTTVTTKFPVTTVAPKATAIEYYNVAAAAYRTMDSDNLESSSDVKIAVANIANAFHCVYVVDQYGNDITLDGGTAATVEVKNAIDKTTGKAFATTQPTVTWSTNGTIAIANSDPVLAAGDTFQVVVTKGTLSRTFNVTID